MVSVSEIGVDGMSWDLTVCRFQGPGRAGSGLVPRRVRRPTAGRAGSGPLSTGWFPAVYAGPRRAGPGPLSAGWFPAVYAGPRRAGSGPLSAGRFPAVYAGPRRAGSGPLSTGRLPAAYAGPRRAGSGPAPGRLPAAYAEARTPGPVRAGPLTVIGRLDQCQCLASAVIHFGYDAKRISHHEGSRKPTQGEHEDHSSLRQGR
jgi:hypothetical protein